MEIISLVAALIGLVAAVVNRKRLIIHRTEYSSPSYALESGKYSSTPITVKKRLKRFALCFVIAFGLLMVIGALAQSAESAATFLIFPLFICVLAGAYQLAAIVIVGLKSLWQ